MRTKGDWEQNTAVPGVSNGAVLDVWEWMWTVLEEWRREQMGGSCDERN